MANTDQYHEPLSSELLPNTDATLTIRIIKSFEFRTQKSMVIKGINLETETVGSLKQRVKSGESGSEFELRLFLSMSGEIAHGRT
jgi:hypothetical protein